MKLRAIEGRRPDPDDAYAVVDFLVGKVLVPVEMTGDDGDLELVGQFLAQLRERMKKFELELHPEKTRLVRFGRFAGLNCHKEGRRKPETLAFLGFTHICGRSRVICQGFAGRSSGPGNPDVCAHPAL